MLEVAVQEAELIRTIEAGGRIADIETRGKHDPTVRAAYIEAARRAITSWLPFPEGRYSGRGIVICGGGLKYFTCAWVAIRMLRHLGCDLPIELWHLGPNEVDDRLTMLVRGLGVEPVDAERVRRDHPVRHLGGWELKCFALLHSRFREVLLLDSDNVPLVDPAAWFAWPEYRSTGAVFWPDVWTAPPTTSAWDAFDVPSRSEMEFESGQIIVDKRACWPALRLAWHYNDHSDYYYQHIYGDKDTFRMAFHRLGMAFAMPATPVDQLDGCMCQHDFHGQRILQHRNMDKYRLDGSNRRIDQFDREDTCRQFLAELRSLWKSEPFVDPHPTDNSRDLTTALIGQTLDGRLLGPIDRSLAFDAEGRIGGGGSPQARSWGVRELDGNLHLSIVGDDGASCLLRRNGDMWSGRWLARP